MLDFLPEVMWVYTFWLYLGLLGATVAGVAIGLYLGLYLDAPKCPRCTARDSQLLTSGSLTEYREV